MPPAVTITLLPPAPPWPVRASAFRTTALLLTVIELREPAPPTVKVLLLNHRDPESVTKTRLLTSLAPGLMLAVVLETEPPLRICNELFAPGELVGRLNAPP